MKHEFKAKKSRKYTGRTERIREDRKKQSQMTGIKRAKKNRVDRKELIGAKGTDETERNREDRKEQI